MTAHPTFSTPSVHVPRNHEIMTVADDGVLPLERQAANRALEVLTRHYPGYTWAVYISHPMFRQDALVIRNLTCNPRGTYGFLMRITAMSAPDAEHKVVVAGGEFLERYNVHRGRIRPEQFEGRIMHFARPET